MAQQSLIYSFVARGTVILVEFTDFKGNFTSVAAQCLQKLPSSNNKFTYNCDGHTFNYLVEDGFRHGSVVDVLKKIDRETDTLCYSTTLAPETYRKSNLLRPFAIRKAHEFLGRIRSSKKMAQQSLIYSFVARGTVILVEFTDFKGNFTSVAAQCLQKLPSSNNKFTYNCDGHTFNYLVEDGFTYCVVAVESAGRQIPMAFLERVKEDFNKRYGGGKAATAQANSLNKEFGSKLKEHMQYCMDHPDEISKLAKVKAQVSEVKGVMMENIEKVLDRGEKIELLVDKTENLRSQAQDFRTTGTQMRRKMWLQNMKIKLIVLAIIVALILIIVLSVCHGFKC
ncbi:hypothetical protein F2Q68_00038306 [Brassica cretica]|uniref:Uncharacterized protein n=6 Tax=Brassica TaxID=3705 RepID=A0A8S9MG11_BRACR|nr:hypothetical protein F2Q68_00038306 [Brassica cretica]